MLIAAMTDKINFLNFFFDAGKYAEPSPIIEFFPSPVFVYYTDSHIDYVNRAFTECFEIAFADRQTHEDVLARLVFKEDLSRFKGALDQLHATRGTNNRVIFTCRLNCKKYESRYFRIHATVLKRTIEGKADSILFVAQDITEELRNDEEVHTLKGLFDDMEETLHSGCWTLSVNDGAMHWTSGLFKLLEYRQDEIKASLTMNFYLDHVDNGYKDLLTGMIRQAIHTGQEFACEYIIQTANASQKNSFYKRKDY